MGKVLIPQDISPEGKQLLEEEGHTIKMGSGITVEEIAKDVEDCDAILARTAPVPAAVLEAGPKLKVVARHGVGVDNIDVKRAEELGIWVTNAPESNAGSVAEHVLMLIAAVARNLILMDRSFRANDFEIRNKVRGVDLAEKTLGVVGMGRIGSQVARKARLGFDMRVIGYDPFLPAERFPEGVERVTDWQALFEQADFVTLHLPAAADTKNIVGAKELAWMKPTAYLINAARGEILDERALVQALSNKAIAGAGLDVYQEEPPARDSPLFGLDNVVLTPHNAALTKEAALRMALHAAQGVIEVLAGARPTWPVNEPPSPRAK